MRLEAQQHKGEQERQQKVTHSRHDACTTDITYKPAVRCAPLTIDQQGKQTNKKKSRGHHVWRYVPPTHTAAAVVVVFKKEGADIVPAPLPALLLSSPRSVSTWLLSLMHIVLHCLLTLVIETASVANRKKCAQVWCWLHCVVCVCISVCVCTLICLVIPPLVDRWRNKTQKRSKGGHPQIAVALASTASTMVHI